MRKPLDRVKLRAYARAWYARNRSKAMGKVRARGRKIAAWFREYKRGLCCKRCGEDDPVTLDFHHRNPSEKDFLPSRACFVGWGIKRILAEIAKCDVLCANCHRKLHRDLRNKKRADQLLNGSKQLLLFPDLDEEPLQQER